MRYGVIGCGKVFQKRHAPSLKDHPDIRFEILCDIHPETLAKAAEIAGVERTATDWNEVVSCKDIDAVLIATLPDLNLEICRAAAAAGKHIYVEKPIACTLREGREIAQVACQAGVKLCVGHQRRFAECEIKARRTIQEGHLGGIYKVFVTHNLPNQPILWGPDRWWDWKYEYGHGRWLHWAVHYVDLLCFLMGDTPTKVICEIAQYGEGGPRLSEDNAWGIFRFQNGGMGIVEIGGTQHVVHRDTLSPEAEERMEICGTKGSIFYARGNGIYRTNIDPEFPRDPMVAEITTTPEPEDMYAQHRRLHEAFAESIQTDGPSPVPGEDAVRALEMILGGYLSMLEGRAVELPLSEQDIDRIEALKPRP